MSINSNGLAGHKYNNKQIMEKVLIKYLRPGMKNAKDMYDARGNIILKAKTVLTDELIQDLYAKNIAVLYVEKPLHVKVDFDKKRNVDNFSFKVDTKEKSIISPKIIKNTLHTVTNLLQDIRTGKSLNLESTQNTVNDMVKDIVNNKEAMINLLEIKSFDDYTFAHSVNVSILTLGLAVNYTEDETLLRKIGTGALLHDIGKIKIHDEILNKRGTLSVAEFEEMKKHPYLGYKIVSSKKEPSKIIKDIILHHHEKWEGTGYPAGLKKNQIGFYARIAAVADVYDALTTNRIYREKLTPYEAMKIIISYSGSHFDPSVTRTFVEKMSIYPPGTIVQLNNKSYAVVEKVNKRTVFRPIVRILIDKNGNEIKDEIIDLDNQTNLFIQRIVSRRDKGLGGRLLDN